MVRLAVPKYLVVANYANRVAVDACQLHLSIVVILAVAEAVVVTFAAAAPVVLAAVEFVAVPVVVELVVVAARPIASLPVLMVADMGCAANGTVQDSAMVVPSSD